MQDGVLPTSAYNTLPKIHSSFAVPDGHS